MFAPIITVSVTLNDDDVQINRLFHRALYVKQNEETSCLRLVHFHEEEGIPSELEANWKSALISHPGFTAS